ncbi:cilium assembly protein DZIP1L-like [Tachysurus vachellii]|uniref:cilium assembly protein DZIP1L-like n=1 Tax=Tachysurus vachellii TaxID=175792 RepID=UPI00296B1036|nr:cilium assembly protein DZIP1L-like [Tachysurus vachellii]
MILESENNRLQKALSVKESTISSVHSLTQQVQSLSKQLRDRETLIHSQKKKTPPFRAEEEDDDESGKDSAYITSSRDKPSTSVHLTSTKEQQRAEHEFSWSDSNESDTQKPHGSVVQTLARSLEKQLSITKPVGGIRVLPPASQTSPRPSIIKQQACQFFEKCFVNYSYLQSHVQHRHPEITDAERHKKMQVEQMKNELEELKEKLRLTQSRLEAEREADVYRRQQEMEEQRRREASDREIMERCKEEVKRTFYDEIDGLIKLLHQEFEQIKSKIISIESKLHELESRERNMSNLRGQNEIEKEQWRIRERELKEQMKNKLKKKIEELQNRHQQEKAKLESENNRLQKALSVKESTISSVHSLTQQVQSLSKQLRDRETLIHSQKKRTPPFSSEEDDDDESGEDSAYITSSRDKPSTSVHLTSTKEQQRAEHEFSWSDSNDSDESDTQKPPSLFSLVSNAVQTLARSLEKQLSITKKPVGGIRVLPPASQPSPRPSIIKQQAVSDEESDLDLSSIEELAVPPTTGRRSSDVAVTSGTSVWSSAASRAGAW